VTGLSLGAYMLLPATAILLRRREGSWYSPATLFTAIWCFLAGIGLLIGPFQVPFTGILFIVAACLAVGAGAEVSRRRLGPARKSATRLQQGPLLVWLSLGCAALSFAAVTILLASRGHGPQVFLSPGALAATAREFAVATFINGWQEPSVVSYLTTFNYLGALLAGVLLATQRTGWTRWVGLLNFIPAVMFTAILTTKQSLLLPLAMATSSYVAARLAVGPSTPPLTVSRAAWLAAGVVMLLTLFLLVQMGRYGYRTPAQAEEVIRLFLVETFAFLGAFAHWLQEGGWATTRPRLGFYTFAGEFDLLHLGHRLPGIYGDQLMIGGRPYNIYTVFRGLIQDFTLPGALVVLAAIGFGAQLAYVRTRAGDIRYGAALAAFYAFALYSWALDIFSYNTVLLAVILLSGLLLWSVRVRGPQRAGSTPSLIQKGRAAVERIRHDTCLRAFAPEGDLTDP